MIDDTNDTPKNAEPDIRSEHGKTIVDTTAQGTPRFVIDPDSPSGQYDILCTHSNTKLVSIAATPPADIASNTSPPDTAARQALGLLNDPTGLFGVQDILDEDDDVIGEELVAIEIDADGQETDSLVVGELTGNIDPLLLLQGERFAQQHPPRNPDDYTSSRLRLDGEE